MLVAAAACSSSAKQSAPTTTRPAGGVTTSSVPADTSLGTGVTATEIKVGVMMIDFSCIESLVDSVQPDQQRAYQNISS